jgi:hypothetical protein
VNPFAKRDSHDARSIVTYKVLTILTWLLSVVVSVYYTIDYPREGVYIRTRIFDLNALYRTGFTLNSVIVEIYW